ncbi:MAG: bifunctional riboflavin kinase/FAD synthetase [Planctomycetes bacterium]|nr:bifunctional riboflavin kinase/FAD synthetase [Planctomycetota bacterium]MCP4769932.1 bifunctional riboflavin kinase/FAD synthetase [Planctomycetota bacterium]MCP4859772.1 bifunctional riboflavin kinase/FAD synthetase [Planctomycetota bacterium]
MLILDGPQALPAAFQSSGCVATVGVFDGVHLGHFHVLRQVVLRAQALGKKAVMVTFASHPKSVLLGQAPATITSLEHRLLLFRRAGIDATLVLDFTPELRELTADQFTRQILLDGLGLEELVFGFDSKFGKDRGGNPDSLQPLAAEKGFSLTQVPPLMVQGRAVSSTAIREAVQLGDFAKAGTMLGRPASLLGTVVKGDGRGKGLGFPTANLDLHHELQPPAGVYATMVRLVGQDPLELLPAVANLGNRPTFEDAGHSIEVHLLDFEGDLYGKEIEVFFLQKLRSEQAFENATELTEQITQDCQDARTITLAAGKSWVIPGKFLPIESPTAREMLGMENPS